MNEVAEPFYEFYNVRVSGTIISESPPVHVRALDAVVATIYPRDHQDYDYFKVWPENDKDPQLPSNHDGKLWFKRSEAVVDVISDEDGNPLGNADE